MSRAIRVSLTNATEGYRFGDHVETLDSTYMGEDATMGEIYWASRKEYGRCTGKVYVDLPTGETRHVGWTFIKQQRYEDTGGLFLQEAWVTVGEYVRAQPETVQYAEA